MSQHIDAVAKQSGLDTLSSKFSTKNPKTVEEFKSLVTSIASSQQVAFVAPAVVSAYITGYANASVSGIITRVNASVADIIWTTNSGLSVGTSRYDISTDTITINDLNGKFTSFSVIAGNSVTKTFSNRAILITGHSSLTGFLGLYFFVGQTSFATLINAQDISVTVNNGTITITNNLSSGTCSCALILV